MRRVMAVFAAVALVASVAGSTAAATVTTKNTFVGDFDQVSWDGSGYVWEHVAAQLFMPTDQRVVPGRFDAVGAAGNPLGLRESHGQIGMVHFWHDPGYLGSANIAFASGVICDYVELNVPHCREFAVMFIDVLDPTQPNQIAYSVNKTDVPEYSTWGWDFDPAHGDAYWFLVGKGDFELKYSTDS